MTYKKKKKNPKTRNRITNIICIGNQLEENGELIQYTKDLYFNIRKSNDKQWKKKLNIYFQSLNKRTQEEHLKH